MNGVSLLGSSIELEDEVVVPSKKRQVKHRPAKQVTFKGGQDRLAHRWFRLTPSFSPHLVADVIEKYGSANSRVLDPFSGRGTTPIECQIRGIECVGAEINPALHFAATTSLDWDVEAPRLASVIEHVLELVRGLKKSFGDASPETVASELSISVPTIHNVYRWWRADVLRDLMFLKYAIEGVGGRERNSLLLVLSSILLDAANITLGRLQLHFIDRGDDKIDALSLFSAAGSSMVEDMRALQSMAGPKATIHLIDNRKLSSVVGDYRADLVVTSPPYPNRYSYVWNTRPHLYFLEWCTTPRDASRLDCDTIGGTWGTATSRHQKGEYKFKNPEVLETVSSIVTEIREKDLLMSNYVAMYFDDLFDSVVETRRCLADSAVCAYVVGNSRAKGSVVETDLLLAELFRHAGIDPIGIEEVRRRNSGKELHETIVFGRHSPK